MEHVAPVEGNTNGEVIGIRILDNSSGSSFTLQANKQSLVSELKGQIASMVDTPSERHRIIYGGKVLKDDQLLSSYKIGDGHTLHLITTDPLPPPSSNLEDEPHAANTEEQLHPILWGGFGERMRRRRARRVPEGFFSLSRANRRSVDQLTDQDDDTDDVGDDDDDIDYDAADDDDDDDDDDNDDNDGETRERASRNLLSRIPSHPMGPRTRGGHVRRARIPDDLEFRASRVHHWVNRLNYENGEIGDRTSSNLLGLIPSHSLGLHGRDNMIWLAPHIAQDEFYGTRDTLLPPWVDRPNNDDGTMGAVREMLMAAHMCCVQLITEISNALAVHEPARINSSNDQGEATDEPEPMDEPEP